MNAEFEDNSHRGDLNEGVDEFEHENNSPGLKRDKGTTDLKKRDSNFSMDSNQFMQDNIPNR